ncbi:peptidase M23 [Shimia sp. R10_1]|uniref:peptidase M23 n=1 Tax=Shimia sp. R10_1 TaxID=2821095 RepID=UPI001ADB581B|nr:peptidase M23 [Shimia sp. R10_1]MBO9472912.1 peptidase M23 [Shimia sp. R10_1]
MQRFAVTALATATAAPALAHSGAHLHPHADHPIWLSLLLGSLAVGAFGLFMRKKK